MIKIKFPEYEHKIRRQENKEFIFDVVRKKWVRLSPEEWVRQNFIQYLILEKNYPAALLAVEKEIMLGPLSKRCDIIAYNKSAKPFMIVECKAMDVALTEKTLQQILRYNISVPVKHLVITNGTHSFGFRLMNGHAEPLTEIPFPDN